MQITINTSEELSTTDLAILALLTGASTHTVVTEPAKAPAKAPATKPAVKPEPEPEPEEEAEEEADDDADLIGGEVTVQDAIDKATELVGQGKQALVKAALKAVGGDRVSNLPASKAAAFIAELEG